MQNNWNTKDSTSRSREVSSSRICEQMRELSKHNSSLLFDNAVQKMA